MSEYVLILKTGRLHEFELACNALREAGIPHYRQEESSSGLKTAVVTPVMGPGNYWNLLVPLSERNNAEKIINKLLIDLTKNPDIWHFSDNHKAKMHWKIFIIITLSISFIISTLNSLKLLLK